MRRVPQLLLWVMVVMASILVVGCTVLAPSLSASGRKYVPSEERADERYARLEQGGSGSGGPGIGRAGSPGQQRAATRWLAERDLGRVGLDLVDFPGSLPSEDEELWIITPAAHLQEVEGRPGTGALMTTYEAREVPVPLEHTEVQAGVRGYIAMVDVEQTFHNPFDGKIEAVYVFPLPQNAGVNQFVMTVGDRKIRGIIRERQEAEEIYQQAKSQGYVASLLTQERPNVFTQHVANIEPGKRIDISIRYYHTLRYDDGWFEYVFPMVVGPRFNPPGSTDGIGAVPRGAGGVSGQSTEVSYLAPHERSGHDIGLTVEVDAGMEIEEMRSINHVVQQSMTSYGRATVVLSELDAIPNKDFILRWRVAGDEIKSAFLAHQDERGGYFTFMLVPPLDLHGIERRPVELVFVLDCSGSMSGRPMEQSKRAMKRALRSLRPDDTFQVIRFSNNASQLGARPLAATPRNVKRGLRYVDGLNGTGGTMMIEGIKAALDFPHDPERLRFVAFMTDGKIGNDVQILSEMRQRLGAARVFSFGVGSSTNRYLMNRMAKLGNGVAAYLPLDMAAAPVIDGFFERISHAAMTDIDVDWGSMNATEVYPLAGSGRLPDLFVGRPVILTGRFDADPAERYQTITVRGRAGDRLIEMPVRIDLRSALGEGDEALASIWARRKISHLADAATVAPDAHGDLTGTIRELALDYNLMSAYTAFIAVDSSRRTDGEFGTTVPVAVPVPDGVRYNTTVGG